MINYYSIINIISDRHDFSWEREWRFNGDFSFKLGEIYAILAKEPDEFLEKCKEALPANVYTYLKYTPIISPFWDTERIIDELSVVLWDLRRERKPSSG